MNFKNTLVVGSMLFATTLFAQDKAAQPEKSAGAMPEMTAEQKAGMEKWQKYMTPGEAHANFAKDNGAWQEELTFWEGGQESKATAKVEMNTILGGRYQTSVHTGDMMGMPFEGHGTVGYDNILKKYQSTWIDNMTTGTMYMEGTFDAKTNTLTMTGKCVDPGTGMVENQRHVLKFEGDSKRTMTFYKTQKGKGEIKYMQIVMTR
jgi:hypothetical protein